MPSPPTRAVSMVVSGSAEFGLQRIEGHAVILKGEFDLAGTRLDPHMDRLLGMHGEAMADGVGDKLLEHHFQPVMHHLAQGLARQEFHQAAPAILDGGDPVVQHHLQPAIDNGRGAQAIRLVL